MPRRTYIAVPTDVVGITDRLTNTEAPFIKHPMIRQTWHTADKFRGMQGYYLAVSNEPLINPATQEEVAGSTFQNYSTGTPHMLSPYEAPHANWWSWALGDVGKARARPFKIRNAALAEWKASDPPSWSDQNSKDTGTFTLLYDQIAWNLIGFGHTVFLNWNTGEYEYPPLASLLDKEILQGLDGTPYSQGYPYAYRYLNSGFSDSDPIVQTSVDGIFEGTLDTTFYDYTMQWEGRTETPSDGDLIAYDWEIAGIYNYYLGTSPAYESIITNIDEILLPNYYILERVRGASGNVADLKYKRQVMLLADLEDRNDPTRVLNENTIQNGFTLLEGVPLAEDNPSTPLVDEAIDYKGIGYMQAYCGELQRLMTANELAGVTTSFASKQKNIAVVASDLPLLNRDVTRDNRGTHNDTSDDIMALDMYPFYNRISIPYDTGAVRAIGGTADNQASVFQQMFDEPGVHDRRALNMLQMYIAYMLSNGTSPASTKAFKLYTEDSSMDKNVVNIDIDFLLDMDDIFAAQTNDPESLAFMEDAVGAYNTPESETPGDSGNLIFLKDYGHNTLGLSPTDPLAPLRGGSKVRLKINTWEKTRSMYEILSNSPCFNETLMYIVEKRVVDNEGVLSTDPVQTFYISKDFKNQSTINYIDTQIKYGAEYQYTVKEVRLVVGSKYKYEDLMIWHTEDDEMPNYGRAVGNALGAYEDTPQRALSTFYENADMYLNVRQNTPKVQYFAGKYVYQPTNAFFLIKSEIYLAAEHDRASQYTDYYYHLPDSWTEAERHPFRASIHLKFKTGDGAGGNAWGGLISDVMTGVFFDPDAAGTQPEVADVLQRTYAEYFIDRIYRSAANNPNWAVQLTPSLQYDWQTYGTPNFFQVKSDQGFQQLLAEGKIFGPPGWLSPSPDDGSAGGMLEMFRVNAGNQTPAGAQNFVPDEAALLVLFTHEAKEETSKGKGFTPSYPGEEEERD